MFNLQGSEIIFILLIALVVLGPEKLPGAIRKVTSMYAELRKLSTGFQDEFKSALEEPMREMKSTADLMKNAASPKLIAEEAEREAALEAAAEKKAKQARDTTSAMEEAGAAHLAQTSAAPTAGDEPPIDAFADPVDDDVPDATAGDLGEEGEEADAAVVSRATPAPRLSSVDLGGADAGTADAPDDESEEKSA